jgi:predicted DNA repair protein MutK
MIGGAYLCYEGSEKVFEALFPHQAHEHEAAVEAATNTSRNVEDEKVSGAIKTDFILSAEIMAITLATVPDTSFWMQALILAIVGIGITALVYGGVALIVKADDAGVALAANHRPISSLLRRDTANGPSAADKGVAPLTKGLGRMLVRGMPVFLRILGIVGTAAMVWVGGGIIIHGLEGYGFAGLGHFIHDIAAAAAHAVPALSGAIEWLVSAAGAGLFGLVLGAILIPLIHYIIVPAAKALRGGSKKAEKHTA